MYEWDDEYVLVKIKNMRCNFFFIPKYTKYNGSNKYSYITNYLTF